MGDVTGVADVVDGGSVGDANPTESEPDPGDVRSRWRPFDGWERQRLIRFWVRVVVVGVATIVAIKVVQPSLVLRNTTPTGGDMGAHVWGPAYLRDNLLPWKLNGWSMDWYSGLPVYRFYMVVPAIFIVLLDVVLPYGVAFKIVAVAGIVTLPVCCWLFGRLARFAYPLPEAFAMIGLVYLLDESYTIYGGNVASTMAGEFSFSISLSFAMLAWGFFANGLQTGRHRAKAAIFMALAVLCHGIVAIYVVVGIFLMALLYIDRSKVRWFVQAFGIGSLLSAFWIVPFLFNHAYMTDMKYKGEPGNGSFTSYWDMFFHLPPFWNMFLLAFAIVGFVLMLIRRNVAGVWLGVTGLVFTAFVYLFNDSLPVIGLLWNPRLLPMLNMCRYLLAAIGVIELVAVVVRWIQLESYARRVRAGADDSSVTPIDDDPRENRRMFNARTVTLLASSFVVLCVLGFRFQVLPLGNVVSDGTNNYYAWGPIRDNAADQGFVDGWARWNFSGYEGREAYGEYYSVVQAMKGLGEERGCGRALWENYSGNDKYGTTMALMLLPFWTKGCIGSSEGLFFEAAGTTPYHFLAAGAMSKQSSNPVRELRYVNNDPTVGVPYMQELGIRYYMAVTPEAVAKADEYVADGGALTPLVTSGPWHIYEVGDSDIVVPLTVEPVVVAQRGGDQRERWLELGTSWLQQRDEWTVLPAADGPDSWQRITVDVDLSRREGEPGADSRKVDIVTPSTPFETRTLEPVEVSDVEVNEESVGFTVSRTGVPILVRVSYFPNWTASGADGPYRVAPNMMVVIPTSNEVRLEFRPSLTDRFAYVLTVVGIGLLFWFRRRDRRSAGIDRDPGFSDGDDEDQGPEPGGKPQVNAGTGDTDSEFA